MAKGKETDPPIEKRKIANLAVEIHRRDGREELWIEGERRRFFRTDDGYTLFDDAYAPPQETLLEAAENYLRKYSEKTE